MLICLVFGVKTDDIEQAREWVERATGLEAEGRESAALGGDYYLFEKGTEELRLISNMDFQDYEPIFTESDEWKIAIRLEGTTKDSAVLRGLEAATDQFVKLERRPTRIKKASREGIGRQ